MIVRKFTCRLDTETVYTLTFGVLCTIRFHIVLILLKEREKKKGQKKEETKFPNEHTFYWFIFYSNYFTVSLGLFQLFQKKTFCFFIITFYPYFREQFFS